MNLRTRTAALAGALLLAPGLLAAEKVKIKPSVTYAKSWEAAVEEGKLLSLPLVVHSHGWN